VEFQDIGGYVSLRHGIVPSYGGDCDTVFLRAPTIGNYSLFFNMLESFVAYSGKLYNVCTRRVPPNQA
jgi:hypothetical protein